MLILHGGGNVETRSNENLCIYGDVILSSALRQIFGIDFSVLEIDADLASRTEPVVGSNLFCLCRSTKPSTNQFVIAGIRVEVLTIDVKTTGVARRKT